jgi:hypothetical protein
MDSVWPRPKRIRDLLAYKYVIKVSLYYYFKISDLKVLGFWRCHQGQTAKASEVEATSNRTYWGIKRLSHRQKHRPLKSLDLIRKTSPKSGQQEKSNSIGVSRGTRKYHQLLVHLSFLFLHVFPIWICTIHRLSYLNFSLCILLSIHLDLLGLCST